MFEQNLATVEVFQRLKGKMTRLLELALQDERLTPLQGYVLMLLAQEETMTISALSERAHLGALTQWPEFGRPDGPGQHLHPV